MLLLYRSVRIGKNGKPFWMYKLRTMVKNADKIGGSTTAFKDKRITKIGAFLRKSKLDELPQIINIIKREMNFVGPRPEVKEYVDLMTEEERKIILSVRPGITDLASLWDFNEAETLKDSKEPDKDYKEKIWPVKKKLQIEYVKSRSLKLDLKIIWMTLLKILLRR